MPAFTALQRRLLAGALAILFVVLVAWMILRGTGKGRPAAEPAPLGEEKVRFTSGGNTLAGVLVLTMRGELIQAVQVIADPRQLSFLNAELASFG